MTKLAIKLFGWDDAQTIVTRTDATGQRWYMAFDICRLLGIVGYSDAVKRYVGDADKKYKSEFTGTSRRRLLMVNHSGLYSLIQAAKTEKGQKVREVARQIQHPLRPVEWPAEG